MSCNQLASVRSSSWTRCSCTCAGARATIAAAEGLDDHGSRTMHDALRALPTCPAGVNGRHKERKEWLSKASSRIWRGSLKSSDWRHLGKGAWAPRCALGAGWGLWAGQEEGMGHVELCGAGCGRLMLVVHLVCCKHGPLSV